MDDLLSKLAIADKPQFTEITSSELEFEKKIGSGGFGIVYKGSWNKTLVAIKVFKLEESIRPSQAAIQNEVETWAKLLHPHVLQFLGANIKGRIPFIVMPYLENGNARDFIESHPECNRNKILHDVTLGLVYLHRRNVVHGDIKGLNVLIDGACNGVLCDFGMAQIKDDILSTSMGSRERLIPGTLNYMPPERLKGGSLRKPCDVYAFGMLIYEVHANANPLNLYVGYTEFRKMVAIEGHRPERPDRDEAPQMTDDIWRLAKSCWEGIASLRPSIDDVCDRIAPSVKLYAMSVPRPEEPPTNVSKPPPSAYDRLRAGATFRERNTIRTKDTARAVSMTHDGKTIASSGYLSWFPSESVIQIWDSTSGALVRSLHGHTSKLTCLAFFKNGSLVSSSLDKTVRVWNLASSAMMVLEHKTVVYCISLSDDNKTIATGSWDGSIRLWDATTGYVTHTLVVPKCNMMGSVSISSDNSFLVALGYVGDHWVAMLWKCQPNGQWIIDVRRDTRQSSSSARADSCCSPSGSRVALSFDKRTVIYDFHGNEIGVGEEGKVTLSPDGNWFTVFGGGALKVWDAASGKMLSKPFQLSSKYTLLPAFTSHDGSTIVVGDDKLLHILVLTDS